MAYLRLEDDELFDRLLSDQRLIVLPLVRAGNDVVIGLDEKAWKSILPTRDG
jgi:arsenate reductase-like glutaredoxin family protein